MPAAVPLAIVGSAAVGAVASSNAAKKTASAARDTASANNATQLQIYNQNRQAQQPFLQGGNTAFQAWQSMMGLTPQQAAAQPGAQPQVLPAQSPTGNALGGGSATYNGGKSGMGPMMMRDPGLGNPLVVGEGGQTYGGVQPGAYTGGGSLTSGQTGQTQPLPGNALSPGGAGGPAAPNALTGYDAFKASMGYQSGLDEGARSVNHLLASRGNLFSGEAGREMQRYGQTYANSFAGDYLSRLMQGTQVGTGAANALAGGGSSYANATNANNNVALNARANANAASGNAIGDLAGAAGSAAAYYYGNREPSNALASSYSGSGRPIFW